MKLRTDVLYSLIAFESLLVAIASVLWFPTWVLAIAVAAFVFSVVEMIVSIVKTRKASYDEVKGKKTYRFPLGQFISFAILLVCLTSTVVLAIKAMFGYMIIPLALTVICLCMLFRTCKLVWGELITCVIALLLIIFVVGYGAAMLVHSNVNLNPGLENDENVTQTPDTENPGTENPGTENPGTENPDTEPPVVTAKIDAPDTMSYGVPVSVKLDGIEADNLKYGNADFISIVKVSDTEVVLTLVGIVNDAGEVEIVPASGYITVTDSVSGVNVSIRIVD